MNLPWSLVEFEKLVADPDQVVEILLLDRDVGADAGMYEEEVSASEMVAQTLQEKLVSAGEGSDKAPVQVDLGLGVGAQLDAVGSKGLHAAQLLPMIKVGGIAKEILHQGIVIATQAHCPILNQPDGQYIDDGPGMSASIDIVSQIDFDRVLYGPASKVLIDARDDLDQQVGPTVDIADSIDPRVCRR